MQIVESGAARGADVREGRRLASLGGSTSKGGRGVGRIGGELGTETFQKKN